MSSLDETKRTPESALYLPANSVPFLLDIVYAGRVLNNSRKITDYNIRNGVTLFAMKKRIQPPGECRHAHVRMYTPPGENTSCYIDNQCVLW